MAGGRSTARKGLLFPPPCPPAGWPQVWAGSTYALWTPTSSAVPFMHFLSLGE